MLSSRWIANLVRSLNQSSSSSSQSAKARNCRSLRAQTSMRESCEESKGPVYASRRGSASSRIYSISAEPGPLLPGQGTYCNEIISRRSFRTQSVAAGSRGFGTRISLTGDGSWDGGEQMADEMIRYSQTQRQKGPDECVKVLEHGLSFLTGDGEKCATSAGRVLLAMSSIQLDRADFEGAIRALDHAVSLDGASTEVQVAAHEAQCGLSLRQGDDSAAVEHASVAVKIAEKAGNHGWDDGVAYALQSRALSALALAEHLRGDFDAAEKLFVKANSFVEDFHEDYVYGSAAASLADAEHCHAAGQLSHASVQYERALHLARKADGGAPHLAVAAAAMAPEEVILGALTGLGQLAAHSGNYDEAERRITEALKQAENIGGEDHPRVGAVLSTLAHVYFCRAKVKGSGDRIVAEGLYRRALQLLGAPAQAVEDSIVVNDFTDLVAVARARYAEVIRWAKNRSSEAEKLRTLAEATWRGPKPLAEALAQGADPAEGEPMEGLNPPSSGSTTKRYSVFDVRLGRVLL